MAFYRCCSKGRAWPRAFADTNISLLPASCSDSSVSREGRVRRKKAKRVAAAFHASFAKNYSTVVSPKTIRWCKPFQKALVLVLFLGMFRTLDRKNSFRASSVFFFIIEMLQQHVLVFLFFVRFQVYYQVH